MSEKIEPKYCPFCKAVGHEVFPDTIMPDVPDGVRYHVGCWNCGARGSAALTEREAIEKWNHREIEPGTSVIRWTRYDGTPETLPEDRNDRIVRIMRVAERFRHNGQMIPNVDLVRPILLESMKIGEWWAYLPEPPEGIS
jgi:hypothetical protein